MIGSMSVVCIGYDNEGVDGAQRNCSRSVEVNLSERADY